MKICTKCKTPKAEKDFNKRTRGTNGLCPQCRECNKKYDQDNRERFKRQRRDQWYRRTYGCTFDDFEKIVETQKGLCAICNQWMTEPHLDHNHATGVLRKALCYQCNVVLGHFNDNADLLTNRGKIFGGLRWRKLITK
jgi:Recombination endonuclease VII